MTTTRQRWLFRAALLGVAPLIPSFPACGAAPPSDAQDISMTVGKSVVLDYVTDIGRVSTTNPEVVDASPVTSRELLVEGKGYGTATLVIWSKSGSKTFYNVTVEQNLDPLRRLLRETFPGTDLRVQSSRDSLSLTGRVATKDIADRAASLAANFAKTVVNNVDIDSPGADRQVVLHVVFALLDRSVGNSFSVNLVSTGAGNTIARTTAGGSPAPTPTAIGSPSSGAQPSLFTISDALNIFAFRPDLNIGAFIKALENQQLLQILAQPNLITSDGKEASFVVGGEFPIPVIQSGASAGAVTIQYKEFGVRLDFMPQITEHQTIRIHVKPEVSSLDYTNAITLNGFTIPALATRRAETNVELGAGQSFVIAGLIDDQVTDSLQRIPGLASLPILGGLFRSKIESRSKTELIIMVTPEITQPLSPGDPKPIPIMPKEFLKPVTPQAKSTHSTWPPWRSRNPNQ